MEDDVKNVFAEMFGGTVEPKATEMKVVPAGEPAEDAGKEPSAPKLPKEDMAFGGASFADEFLAVATQEQMSMLKSGERTLHGFFNWAFSKAKAEYVRANGSVTGGGWWDVGRLAAEYFSDAVKEGDTVKCEPPSRPAAPAAQSPAPAAEKPARKQRASRKSAAAKIERIAKAAAADAKAEAGACSAEPNAAMAEDNPNGNPYADLSLLLK